MTTGLFARTSPEAMRHAAPDRTQCRYMVVVSSDRPELFDEMTRRFQNSPDTSVVFDRELERRDAPSDGELRRAIETNLWIDGYAIIRTN